MGITPVMNGGINAPLEGDDVSAWNGFRAAVGNAEKSTLGQTLIDKARGNAAGGAIVSQKDAVAQLKAQNYDTDGVPAEGMSEGALLARMNRASYLRQTQDEANRAHLGTTTQVISKLAGQAGDPLNVVLAPLAAIGAGPGASIGIRLATGAAEGVIATNAYERAQNAVGASMGDKDIGSAQMLRDMMFGAGVGSIAKGSFGPRPMVRPNGGPLTLDMIDKFGERSDAAAKVQGVSVDDVVSPKGAVGRYQVMPSTARALGMTEEQLASGMLRNPDVNRAYAQKLLDQLNTRYKGDPEAAAIAYNAGPRVADRFVASGRDYSVLPRETQGYAARIMGMPRQVRTNAIQMAVAQMDRDTPVDVKPTIDMGYGETYGWRNANAVRDAHDLEVSQIESDAFRRSMPGMRNVFTEEPETREMLDRIEQQATLQNVGTKPEEPTFGNNPEASIEPELSELVKNDTEEAKQLQGRMNGEPQEGEKLLYEEPEPLMIDGMKADEHQKAVEAAVRCGLLKGGFSGS